MGGKLSWGGKTSEAEVHTEPQCTTRRQAEAHTELQPILRRQFTDVPRSNRNNKLTRNSAAKCTECANKSKPLLSTMHNCLPSDAPTERQCIVCDSEIVLAHKFSEVSFVD